MLEDVGLDLLRGLGPLRLQVAVAADLGELGGPVERDPAHELRGHVVLWRATRLPDPLVGVLPHLRRALGLRMDDRPEPLREPLAPSRVEEDRVENRAEHIVLALVEGSVPDPDRTRPGVAGEMVEGRFRQVAATVDPVHDLHRAVVVGLHVGDELHEIVGLGVQVQVVQRLQGEGRISHPRVPVVPVAFSAGGLRERRRERSDRRAGRHVGQSLDRERRALDGVAPHVVRDARPAEPVAPERDGRRHPSLGVLDVVGHPQLVRPGQCAERLLSRRERVPRAHAVPLDPQCEV